MLLIFIISIRIQSLFNFILFNTTITCINLAFSFINEKKHINGDYDNEDEDYDDYDEDHYDEDDQDDYDDYDKDDFNEFNINPTPSNYEQDDEIEDG